MENVATKEIELRSKVYTSRMTVVVHAKEEIIVLLDSADGKNSGCLVFSPTKSFTEDGAEIWIPQED